jgi:ZIP family zinc transporter
LQEAIGSAADIRETKTRIIWLWVAVSIVCTAATVLGFAVADVASDTLRSGIDGFAAGALLVMLIDSMIPDAREKGGAVAGLVTVLGFALAAALSLLT